MSDQPLPPIPDDGPADAPQKGRKLRQVGSVDQPHPWLIDMAELAWLTSLSLRTLRRMDSAGDIPGRVTVGRRVLFQTETIREWVRTGLPVRDQWSALQKPYGKR